MNFVLVQSPSREEELRTRFPFFNPSFLYTNLIRQNFTNWKQSAAGKKAFRFDVVDVISFPSDFSPAFESPVAGLAAAAAAVGATLHDPPDDVGVPLLAVGRLGQQRRSDVGIGVVLVADHLKGLLELSEDDVQPPRI